ncbi:MAG: hypothetical protein V1760_00665 [Candidatus Peregrinibacteria bacterium]
MTESILFVLISGTAIGFLVAWLGWPGWLDPRWIIVCLFLLLVPGLWGAFTTGPFVPSGRKRHQTMLKLAKLNPSDTVYELGAGGFGLTFAAAKISKKSIGYEISIPLVLFAKLKKLVIRSKAKVRLGSIWNQNYSDADVLFCYLMPHSMKRVYKEIWPQLKPGTRLITNAFRIHDLKPITQENSVYVYQV